MSDYSSSGNDTGTGFAPSISGFPCHHFNNAPESFSPVCCSYQADKRAEALNISKECCFSSRVTLGIKVVYIVYTVALGINNVKYSE